MNRIEVRRVSQSLKDFGLQAELNMLLGRGYRIVSVFPEGQHYVIVAQNVQQSPKKPVPRPARH